MNSTELIKGTLIPIILKLLEENGKMYGYEIALMVKDMSGGKILIKEGSLYPALHKLLDDGLVGIEIRNVGKRVRKYYFLTEKGVVKKQEYFKELEDFLKMIKGMMFPQLDFKLEK